MTRLAGAALALSLLLAACGGGDEDPASAYEWNLPAGFPTPWTPADNPMSEEKVVLGRHLFYDKRLSGNETYACATCHDQSKAFSDGIVTPVGSTGMHVARNSMSLANLGYLATYTWANPLKTTLEDQALTPLIGDLPVELGIAAMVPEVMDRLRGEPRYEEMFSAAFPGKDDPFTLVDVTRALACFERALLSGASPYDQYVYGGDASAMSESALRGLALFNSEKTECYHCHNATNFTLSWRTADVTEAAIDFRNTGLYNIGGEGDYPGDNQGLYEFTKDPADRGKFRVAPLRNVARTAPYMHDGSIATLPEVIAFYAAGGRNVTEGPHAGDGRENPNKSPEIRGFELTAQETDDLLAFLESLTDEAFLTSEEYSNPWVD